MKKIYNLLAAVVLFIAGATTVQAQYWVVDQTYGDGFNIPNVETIVPGTPYALLCANSDGSYGQYLCNDGKSTAITDSCLFVFEVTGTNNDGEDVYVLKRNTDGKYLMNDEGVKFTNDIEEAYKFTAGKADWVAKADIENLSFEDLWASGYTKFISCSPMGADTWVFPAEPFDFEEPTYFAGWWAGNEPAFWSYTDTNAWMVVPAVEAKGYEWITALLNDKFPNGFSADAYAVGTNPGQCDQEALDACQAAYDACYDLMIEESTDDAACRAAGAELLEAYETLVASVKPIGPGYYYFVNGRDNGTIYASENGVNWTPNYQIPETPTLESAAYIWRLSQSEENPNLYYIQNYKTGKYIGAQDGLSKILPQTSEPFGYYVRYSQNNQENLAGYFDITNPANTSWWGLHTQVAGYSLVYWDITATGSLWQVVAVDEAALEELRAEVDQNIRNEELAELVGTAQAAYDKACDQTSIVGGAKDGSFPVGEGLITDESQIGSNSIQEGEGSIAAMLDGDPMTYFHSKWGGLPEPQDTIHNLILDLGEELDAVAVKLAKRFYNATTLLTHGIPDTTYVYGCNDADLADPSIGEWEFVDTIAITYDYTFSGVANAAGVFTIKSDKPYQYYRLDMSANVCNAKQSAWDYFCVSELRVYEVNFDPSNATVNAIPAEIVNALTSALAKANEELANGAATQATIDELNAAYEAWIENYPDPAVLTDLLKQAETLIENAAIGDELGYYPQSAVDALQAVVDEVTPKVKPVMTLDEINPLKEQLRAAIAAFNNSLAIPSAEGIYYIESAADSPAGYHRLYAANSGTNNNIQHGYYTLPEGEDVTQDMGTYDQAMDQRLNAMWQVIKNEDGSVSIRNLATGLYIANPKKNNTGVKQVAEPDSFILRGAPQLAGAFNVVLEDGIYLNAQPNGNNPGSLVTWNTASGADNSAFKFIEVDAMPMAYSLDMSSETRVWTLPIDVTPFLQSGVFYDVEGQKDGELYLVENTDEVLKAGTPVIYVPNEDAESYTENLFLDMSVTSPADLVYNFVPFEVNGLQGVIDTVTVKDVHVFRTNKVRLLESATTVAANTGYFKFAPALDAPVGTVTLATDGLLASEVAIDNISVNPTATVDVYTISGVRLRSNVKGGVATRNLPAGLYIIGGKKVLVK